jgi:hypothetical protein
MDDKTFELLEKMYSEFTGRFEKLETGQEQITRRLDKLEVGQKKIDIKLEHDISNSLQSLHEGVAGNTATLKEHTERLNAIENKVDYITMSITSQDKRLKVVESSKKKAK